MVLSSGLMLKSTGLEKGRVVPTCIIWQEKVNIMVGKAIVMDGWPWLIL